MSDKLEEHDKDSAYFRSVRALLWIVCVPVILMDFFWPELLPEIWKTFFNWLVLVGFIHYFGASAYFAKKHMK